MNNYFGTAILAVFISICFQTSQLVASNQADQTAQHSVELKSSNLPIIIINTNGQQIIDERRIRAQMKVIYNGAGQRNSVSDPANNYDGWIAIELRGSASISYPKKSYRLETQDSKGNNLNVSLIGMPTENDWVLYGPYDDQSLIRNVLAYKLSNDIGRYASRTRFCELVLNNDYRGVYVLIERIKRDKNRVDISKLDSLDRSGDAVTGGYIIKFDKVEGENVGGWWSNRGIFYQYHYPRADVILPEQKAYIRNFMNQFEAAMSQPNIADPNSGYPKYIDVASFVDHFIINEFCKNVDAYRISNFMYKDRDSKGGKLCEGPIWDFNLSFGKAWYKEDLFRDDEWEVDHNHYKPNDWPKVPFWWERLGHDPTFAQLVEQRWRELRATVLSLDYVYRTIDLLVDTLREARVRNFDRWPETAKDHSYETEILMMKLWINDRVNWIEKHLGQLSAVQNPSREEKVPIEFVLEQNYPNPFNSTTTICYQIPHPAKVLLTIVNIQGQEIARLFDGSQLPGRYQISWDGKDHQGIPISSGIYFYQLRTNEMTLTQKLLLIR